MDALLLALLAWLLALVINVVPAFMPPTWALLAVFHYVWDVPLLLLTIGGAAASTVGRVLLAVGCRRFAHWLPDSDQRNAAAFGDFINRHRAWRLGIVFAYCLGPFPSNALFIAAGVGRVQLRSIAPVFLVSRLIADSLWVWLAGAAAGSVRQLFDDQLTSWPAILVQVAALISVVVVFRLPWARWLGMAGSNPDASREAALQKG